MAVHIFSKHFLLCRVEPGLAKPSQGVSYPLRKVFHNGIKELGRIKGAWTFSRSWSERNADNIQTLISTKKGMLEREQFLPFFPVYKRTNLERDPSSFVDEIIRDVRTAEQRERERDRPVDNSIGSSHINPDSFFLISSFGFVRLWPFLSCFPPHQWSIPDGSTKDRPRKLDRNPFPNSEIDKCCRRGRRKIIPGTW